MVCRSDQNVNRSSEVQSIVQQSLKYLDTRSKFWRQTLPLHALRSMQTRNFQLPVASLAVRDDSSLPTVIGSSRSKRGMTSSSNTHHYVLREVFKVHQGKAAASAILNSSELWSTFRRRFLGRAIQGVHRSSGSLHTNHSDSQSERNCAKVRNYWKLVRSERKLTLPTGTV